MELTLFKQSSAEFLIRQQSQIFKLKLKLKLNMLMQSGVP